MAGARRTVVTLAVAAAWWLVSCREVPAPEGGVAAVSPVVLPLPGVVAGDTMRDSLGVVAPLRVIAYGLDGEPMSPQPSASFVVLDTGAHVVGALLLGDSVGRSVRIVGTVGPLQTQFTTVKVTAAPDSLVAADSIVHHKSYSTFAGDSIALSADLAVLVRSLAGTGVEAVIVRYTIDQAPVGNGSGPTVVLTNGNVLSSRDTTDASGRAARVARLRLSALPEFDTDTVLVSAVASYRGQVLGVVPFLIIFAKQ